MRFALKLLLIAACASALADGAAALADEAPAPPEDPDQAALTLADRTSTTPAAQRACSEYLETAVTDTTYTDSRPSSPGGRASFNLRCETTFAGQWRGVFSNRFDELFARGASAQAVNTLKEAYVSHHGSGVILDLGRINVREGVALAYNPTDYFKANAVRTVISINPEALRDERMGALMSRAQAFWSSGSLTGMFAPRVSARPNDSTFSPDFGTTNSVSRWVLIWSQALARDFQPQLSLSGAEHDSLRAGLNLTRLLSRAAVAYIEWSGSRTGSNLYRSGYPVPADTAFHSRLSTGITYTTSYKLSWTLEYEYDGAAPGRSEWAAVRSGPIPPYVRFRQYAAMQGELTTRQNVFAYVHWDDVLISRLGLTAFARIDPYDHSRIVWAEARYHWQHAGLAIQWQQNAGDPTSDLAPRPVHQSWFALLDYYF